MFKFDANNFTLSPDPSKTIERTSALAADLHGLSKGVLPAEHVLAAAPMLDGYYFVQYRITTCMGILEGRTTRDGMPTLMRTSQVMVDGRALGWVRTRSGYYRVKREIPSPEPEYRKYFGDEQE